MAFLQWRRFNFFDKEYLVDSSHELFEKLKDLRVTCVSSGRGHVVIGDADGYVHVINRHLEMKAFRAFEQSVTHIHQISSHPYLITAGADEPGINPLIKVWNLEKYDHRDRDTHLCTRVIRANSGFVNPTTITSIDILDSLTMMAVGFADGQLMVFRGDITRERHSKHKVLPCSEHPITGVKFRDNKASIGGSNAQKQIILFVSTTREVMAYNLTVKDKESRFVIDNIGCDPDCCCVMSDSKTVVGDNLFIIGRKDAVYFYTHDDRGQCLAFEGDKLVVHWFRSYLVIVSKDMSTIGSSKGFEPGPSTENSEPQLRMNIVTIYDIQNKFIAFSSPVPTVVDVFSEWGSLYILCIDGRIIHLRERDTQTKLEMLFRKNQFSLAISVAKSHQLDEDGLADIFKQYGDFLYKKGDYDAAIVQYVKTIGRLEASYVIRKFLDAQRIHNLTAYLQSLHKQGVANEDHTTLLLNCYTKLKDVQRLEEFIKSSEVDFDVETAIKVLRQAGLFTEAIYLASKHKHHHWFFKIQLEDKCDAIPVIDYMTHQMEDQLEVVEYLKKYGRLLMSKEPRRTTQMIKSLCKKRRRDDKKQTGTSPSSFDADRILEDMGIYLGTETGEEASEMQDINPDEFIHIFVNHIDELTEFLEYVIEERPEKGTTSVYDTLLELYLTRWKNQTNEELRNVMKEKILNLMKNERSIYDVEQILILCQMSGFKDGLLLLYEKMQLYSLILRYYIENENHHEIIRVCEKFGDEKPELWIEALLYFSAIEESPRLGIVLDQIEKKRLLPPVRVVEILSRYGKATIGDAKNYLIRRLTAESNQISDNQDMVNEHKEKTEKMRKQIAELQTNAKVFKASKCFGCNAPLELPSVHFLCGHSYHQQCFESYNAENDAECPLCLPENRRILEKIRSQESLKNIEEVFRMQLQKAEDPFQLIASFFGRGVFNRSTNPDDEDQLSSAKSSPAIRHKDVI